VVHAVAAPQPDGRPSLYARMRQPSTFSSNTQPSRWQGCLTWVGPSACTGALHG
jgi:hypothetical protein